VVEFNEPEVITGRLVKGLGRKPKQYPAGRTCQTDDCTTKLSVYNKAEFCSPHEPFRAPRIRGSK
jgi:hypothetical protein